MMFKCSMFIPIDSGFALHHCNEVKLMKKPISCSYKELPTHDQARSFN